MGPMELERLSPYLSMHISLALQHPFNVPHVLYDPLLDFVIIIKSLGSNMFSRSLADEHKNEFT
jgi:hypothetical protein